MVSRDKLKRTDATTVRFASAALGTGLGVIWIVGVCFHANPWLVWMVALAGLACFGTIALVPKVRAGFIAAGNLAVVDVASASAGLCPG